VSDPLTPTATPNPDRKGLTMALTVNEFGYPSKLLPGGLVAEVVPLTFGRARITVRPGDSLFLTEPGW
jgi:hypothetical protein